MLNLIIQYGTIVAIIIRAISCIVILFFVMPLLIREATVKNGLRKLRFQMLGIGIILLFTNIFSIWLAVDTLLDIVPASLLHSSLQLVNAISFLAFSIILYLVYHQQYSPASKEIHRQVDVQEKATKLREEAKK